MNALLKQIEQGIKGLDVNDVDHRVDRAVFEKKIADWFNAKGIVYKKGSDRFTPAHWNQLNELAEKHQQLSEPELIKIVKNFLQENAYTFHDVRQTIKENKTDIPSGPKRDGRSFAGAVPALLAIASNVSSAGSADAMAVEDDGREVISKMTPSSPERTSRRSAQPASSNDSAQTEGSAQPEEPQDIEVIERPLATDEMLQRLKLKGVVHGQDPKKPARVVDITNALKEHKVEHDAKLKRDDKIKLLYDIMYNV